MGNAEIETFLTHLTVDKNVSASTQNQALSAILFLYHQVLEIDLAPVTAVRAKKTPHHLPVILTREEAMTVIAAMSGTNQLIAKLIFGFGLRLIECLRLRVQDLDFDYRQINVRDDTGEIARVTMLPSGLLAPLREHLRRVRMRHQRDLEAGHGDVYLPTAVEQKYPPLSGTGPGNTPSPPAASHATPAPANVAATTWPAYPNPPPASPSATPLPSTC